MDDGRCFPVHQFAGADDIAAKDLANRLMAEADAEDWRAAAKLPDDVAADASFVWRAGAGRNADVARRQLADFIHTDGVVANDFHFRAQLAEVLNEVVGEGVVVIDDEEHGEIVIGYQLFGNRIHVPLGRRYSPMVLARPMARRMAMDLLTVSLYS